jgi:hypothetical protein
MSAVKKVIGLSMAGIMVAAVAFAGAPLPGVYQSQAAQVLHGRYAESFDGGGWFSTGNVNNSASWNGAALGTQWSYTCPEVTTVNLVSDNGLTKTYQLLFDVTNGTFFLNGTGEAWDGGDASYTGVIDQISETGDVLYDFFNNVIAWDTDVQWSGRFDGYSTVCINWTANNAYDSGAGAGYPAYLHNDCSGGGAAGQSGNHTDITITIGECEVPTENATWGAIKDLYNKQ